MPSSESVRRHPHFYFGKHLVASACPYFLPTLSHQGLPKVWTGAFTAGRTRHLLRCPVLPATVGAPPLPPPGADVAAGSQAPMEVTEQPQRSIPTGKAVTQEGSGTSESLSKHREGSLRFARPVAPLQTGPWASCSNPDYEYLGLGSGAGEHCRFGSGCPLGDTPGHAASSPQPSVRTGSQRPGHHTLYMYSLRDVCSRLGECPAAANKTFTASISAVNP